MIRVTRRYQFAASHRLHAPQLSEEANRELYGKCNNPYGHGHNYSVEVSAIGPADARTGLAVRLQTLDGLVKREVIEPFDHRDLNRDSAAFTSQVATTENLAREIGRRLKAGWREAFPGEWPKFEKIRIAETPRNIFEVRSDEIE